MTVNWFRDPSWDEAARAKFERRLSRARPESRPQYLRIKGLALAEARNVDAARALFERVLKDYADSPDAPAALEHLADLARNEGHQGQAEQTYRELLNRWPSLNGTTGMAEVSLAELLLDGGGKEAADEAVRLLNSAIARGGPITFNANLFRWHIALVRAAELLGDRETVRRAARTALDLADRPPQFPRHPSVGVVSADSELLRWLRRRAEL